MSYYYSSSEGGEYWQRPYEYGEEYSYYNTNRTPFCSTMGQPLIYYTKIIPERRNKNSKANSSNCFVKAFRWYTQDLVPRQKEGQPDPKVGEFATWLDAKYDQFLTESQQDPDVHQLKIDQHSGTGTDTDRTPESCATERFGKCKRHKKRRASVDNKHVFNGIAPRNKSMEYIMTPKEITGTPDILKSPFISCCSVSVTPNKATDVAGPVKVKITPLGSQTDTPLLPRERSSLNLQTGGGVAVGTNYGKDNACQCDDTMSKVNVQSQYEARPIASPTEVKLSRKNSKTVPRSRKASFQNVSHQSLLTSRDSQKIPESRPVQIQTSKYHSCECPPYYENSTLVCDKNKISLAKKQQNVQKSNRDSRSSATYPERMQCQSTSSGVPYKECSVACPAKMQTHSSTAGERELTVVKNQVARDMPARKGAISPERIQMHFSLSREKESLVAKNQIPKDVRITECSATCPARMETEYSSTSGDGKLTKANKQIPSNAIIRECSATCPIRMQTQPSTILKREPFNVTNQNSMTCVIRECSATCPIRMQTQPSTILKRESFNVTNQISMTGPIRECSTTCPTRMQMQSSTAGQKESLMVTNQIPNDILMKECSATCSIRMSTQPSKVEEKQFVLGKKIGSKTIPVDKCNATQTQLPLVDKREVLVINNLIPVGKCSYTCPARMKMQSSFAEDREVRVVEPSGSQNTPIRECSATCPAKILSQLSTRREKEMVGSNQVPVITITNRSNKQQANEYVQTSDHSIILESAIREYPLFLKITCADKLKENK